MRSKFFAVLSVMVVALALGVASASADQIQLGDNTCTGGPWTVTTAPNVSGSAFNCTDDSSAKLGGGSISVNDLSYTITPITGTTASISVTCDLLDPTHNCTGDALSGTVTWSSATSISPLDILVGSLLVSSASGFNGEYATGGSYLFDLTLQGCTSVAGGVSCTHPSSGEIPVVPEPATLSLVGLGLLALGRSIRRKV
jgi:PEP-CTERM motif-containing protein